MNEKKIISLLQSEEFLAKLNDAETVAETKNLFQSEGLNISDEKIKVIMEALQSASKKAHNGEMLSEEDLESVSGGALIISCLEIVILCALIYEGARVAENVRQKGGINNETIVKYAGKAKDVLSRAEDTVVNWLAGTK